MRWFNTIVNQPNFKAVVGSVNLCEVAAEGGAASGGGGGGKKKDQVIKALFPLIINPQKTLFIFSIFQGKKKEEKKPKEEKKTKKKEPEDDGGDAPMPAAPAKVS